MDVSRETPDVTTKPSLTKPLRLNQQTGMYNVHKHVSNILSPHNYSEQLILYVCIHMCVYIYIYLFI